MANRVSTEQLGAVEKKVDALAASVDARFDAVDARFDAVDARFGAVDAQFEDVARAFAEQRAYTDAAFERLEGHQKATNGRLARIERKLDQFIDTQSKTNELVERRLTRLEDGE